MGHSPREMPGPLALVLWGCFRTPANVVGISSSKLDGSLTRAGGVVTERIFMSMRQMASSVALMTLVAGMAVGLPAGMAEADDKQAAPQAAAGVKTTADLNAPLPVDPRFVRGELPNGLKYIVMQHSNPPGRAAMYIHVSTGSFNEKDNQRGIAHYLEHMAFNGSENFPPNTVIDFFQAMGLSFGQHQNAFTSFDQTAYILFFPDVKPDTVEKGMRFFSDVAMRLALDPKEIEEERGIIIEEKRTRAGGQQRMQDYVLERLAPGSLIGSRLPIGTEQTIKSVMREDFLDYYSKYYVPSNMTVMVVADTEPKAMVEQITRAFSSGENKPRPADVDPGVKPTSGTSGVVASDKEQTSFELQLMRIWPKREPTTTVGTMRRDLVDQLASGAFNRRFGAKLAAGGTSYLSASGGGSDLFNVAFTTTLSAEGDAGKWKQILAEVASEAQRARLHGFTQREIDDMKAAIISSAERFVEQEKTLPARAVIQQMNSSVASGDVMMGAADELKLVKELLPTITREEISSVFARDFDMSSVVAVGQFPSTMADGSTPPSEAEFAAEARKALDVKPSAESESERPTSLMATLPKPGTIASQETHEASKVISGWLSNNIRFHYRFMDYRKDQVTVAISLAAGTIQETAANRGVAEVAGLAWSRPATSTLSSTNVRDLMTGKKAMARGGSGMDTMALTVSGSPAELETGMQLAHLLLTDPVIEKAAYDQWKKRQLQEIEERAKVVEGVFAESLATTIYPETELRPQPLTAAQVNATSIEAGQAFLKNAIKTAPMEVSIVGDISPEKAMDLLKTFVGSLPARDKIDAKTLDNLRVVQRPKGPRVIEKTVDSATDKALVAVGFYGPDADNVVDRRDMQIASRVLSTRIIKRVREAEQLVYSAGANLRPGQEFPGFGTLALIAPTKPTKTARLVEVANEIYADFAKDGPTAEELDVAKKQIANTLDEQYKEPAFWLQNTSMMTYRDTKLDDVLSAPEYYQKLTGERVRDTFRKYYTPEAQMALIVKPKETAAAGEGAKE